MRRPYEDGASVMLKSTLSFAISLAVSAAGETTNARLAFKTQNSQMTENIVNAR